MTDIIKLQSKDITLEERRFIMEQIGTLGDRIWTLAIPIQGDFSENGVTYFTCWENCIVHVDIIIESAEEIKRQLARLQENEANRISEDKKKKSKGYKQESSHD